MLESDNWPRGVRVSTLDPESSDRGSNPREVWLWDYRPSVQEDKICKKTTPERSPHLQEEQICKKTKYARRPNLHEDQIYKKTKSARKPNLQEDQIWKKTKSGKACVTATARLVPWATMATVQTVILLLHWCHTQPKQMTRTFGLSTGFFFEIHYCLIPTEITK